MRLSKNFVNEYTNLNKIDFKHFRSIYIHLLKFIFLFMSKK